MAYRLKYESRPGLKYLLAFLITITAIILQYAVIYGAKIPVPGLLYPAAFLVAWFLGFGPAVLSIFLSSVGASFLFYEPRFSFHWMNWEDGIRLAIFAVTSFLAAWIVARGRKAELAFLKSQSRLEESERLFRKVADEAPALIWRSGVDKAYDWFNQGWLDFTGRTIDAEIGHSWPEQIHPEDRKRAIKVYSENFDARKIFSMEYRMLRHDGQYRWLLVRGAPRFSSQGEFLGFIGTCLDIHERHEAVSALKSLQSRFERSAAATDLGVWYCDLPFDELIWNAKTREHFFVGLEDRITLDIFYERIHPDDRGRVEQAIECSVMNRAPYDIEFRTVHAENPLELRWLRAIGWTDFDLSGRAIRFDGITLDNTTIRKIAEERDSSLEKAKQAIQVRDEFLSISSHELRTPLTPLKLQIQSIGKYLERGQLQDLSDDRLKRMLGTCEKQVSRLTALVEDLLDVSRISSGRLTLNFESVDLSEALREVVERFLPQLQNSGCEVRLSAPAELLARVDRLRFEQIVINFLTNSMRYAKGKPIEVSLTVENAKAVLKVRDQGIGISREDQKRIFDRFERVLSSTNYGGLGLGLFIVRQIVLAHGGNISVESELGQGATFIVVLPLPSGDQG